MTRCLFAIVVAALLATDVVPTAQAPAGFCVAPARAAGRSVRVNNTRALEDAVARAGRGDTILIADGTYSIGRTLDISAPDVTLRGASGDRTKVVIAGQGMTEDPVGVGIGINAPGVMVADLTVRNFRLHDVQVRGEQGASRFTLFNAIVSDAGQQLLKGSAGNGPPYADEGLVACSEFSYTTQAPSDYTNGVDVLAGKGWTVRDSRFIRIRGPMSGRFSAGPAILMWGASEDTVVERNVIIDSFRGIALGLAPGLASVNRQGEKTIDHRGGIIRNNVVVNLNGWGDEAIEANAARDVRIEHNTVLVEGSTPWSIGVRFASASALVRNNLTNQRILLRDGGQATMSGNVIAQRQWFVDPAAANLRVMASARAAVRAPRVVEVAADFDGRSRGEGNAVSAGAFE